MANATTMIQKPKPAQVMTLANVRKGKIEMPIRCLVFGSEGVGKSTFAAGAPSPIFLGAESGTMNIDIDRLPEPKVWQDVLDGIALLENEKHDYKTIAVDPLNWLESLVFAQLTGGGAIEDFGGGFGKGYTAALDQWRVFLSGLERLWRGKGMHVILTAHSQVKSFQNPEGPSYDRYELAMNAKAAGLFRQWVDFVLFARLEATTKIDPATKKAKGIATGARILHTQWSAAFDAKSRMKLPEELPLSWDAFWDATQAETARGAELAAQIGPMLEALGDAAVTKFVTADMEKHKGNADRLAELVNRLAVKLEEKSNKEQSK